LSSKLPTYKTPNKFYNVKTKTEDSLQRGRTIFMSKPRPKVLLTRKNGTTLDET